MKYLLVTLVLFSEFITPASSQNWTQISSGTSHNLYSNWWDANNPDFGVLVGFYWLGFDRIPVVGITNDGGSNWDYPPPIGNGSYYGGQVSYFTSGSTGYVAGQGLQKTFDGGSSWTSKIDAANGSFYDMVHITPSKGYLVGTDFIEGLLFTTTNGWNTWAVHTISTIVTEIRCIQRPSSTAMYAGANDYGSGNNTIFKSTDDGNTWSELNFTEDVYTLAFTSSTNGYAGTTTGIWRTTDGGSNWSLIKNTSAAVNNIELKNNEGFAVCNDGRIYKSTDNGVTWADMGQPAGNKILNDVFIVSATLAYAVGNNGTLLKYSTVLPVEIAEFKADLRENKAFLNWQTLSEKNNSGFTIQKSIDTENWKDIGFIKGAGISSEKLNYQYNDEFLFSGPNYYRLVQNDFDGHQQISTIKSVNFESKINKLDFYPNPVHDFSVVKQLNDESKIKLFDVAGRELTSFLVRSGNICDFTSLPNGIYFLHLDNNKTCTIIKN